MRRFGPSLWHGFKGQNRLNSHGTTRFHLFIMTILRESGKTAGAYSPDAPASRAASAAAWERRCMPSLASSEDT
jgi:hypothetical protein